MKRFRERIEKIQQKRSKAEKDRLAHDKFLQEAQEKAHRDAEDITIPPDIEAEMQKKVDNADQTVPYQVKNWNFELVFSSQIMSASQDADTSNETNDNVPIETEPHQTSTHIPSETASKPQAISSITPTNIPPTSQKPNKQLSTNEESPKIVKNDTTKSTGTPYRTTTSIFAACNADSEMTTESEPSKSMTMPVRRRFLCGSVPVFFVLVFLKAST